MVLRMLCLFREWQRTIHWEGDGGVVDEHIKASVGLLQEVGQLLNGLLVVDVQLVKLDLNTILRNKISDACYLSEDLILS